MVQHPIPRQITTFEFKLIGFLTLKQFLYLVVFVPSAFLVYKIIPLPILNLAAGGIVLFMGIAFAFIPINDRPFDVWIKNLLKRLSSPTQFIYKKDDKALYFLEDLYFLKDPHIIATHIESKEKLKSYLNKTSKALPKNTKKQTINNLLINSTSAIKPQSQKTTNHQTKTTGAAVNLSPPKAPFLVGVTKNHKGTPIPALLIYIKNQNGDTIRLLKSNLHGVFATFSPLSKGEYKFEIKDPLEHHFFDTMKMKVDNVNPKPFEFTSKELI